MDFRERRISNRLIALGLVSGLILRVIGEGSMDGKSITLLLVLLLAVIMDFRERRISNRLIALGLVSGLILRVIGEGSIGIVHFIVNISIPVILLFLLFQLRALGAGDIKLFSVVGGFVMIQQLLASGYLINSFISTARVR